MMLYDKMSNMQFRQNFGQFCFVFNLILVGICYLNLDATRSQSLLSCIKGFFFFVTKWIDWLLQVPSCIPDLQLDIKGHMWRHSSRLWWRGTDAGVTMNSALQEGKWCLCVCEVQYDLLRTQAVWQTSRTFNSVSEPPKKKKFGQNATWMLLQDVVFDGKSDAWTQYIFYVHRSRSSAQVTNSSRGVDRGGNIK